MERDTWREKDDSRKLEICEIQGENRYKKPWKEGKKASRKVWEVGGKCMSRRVSQVGVNIRVRGGEFSSSLVIILPSLLLIKSLSVTFNGDK